jgi:hypothetical protein
MAQTWKVTIRQEVAGANGRDAWINVFHFNSANALGSPEIAAELMPLASALRHSLLQSCVMLSMTISDPTKRAGGYDPAKVRTIPLGLAGQKEMGAHLGEPKETVVKLTGNAGTGRPAHCSLRMNLYDDEAYAGGSGDPFSPNPGPAVGDTVAALNAAIAGGLSLRAYSLRKTGAITDSVIASYTYAGVGFKSARRRHKKRPGGTKGGLASAAKGLNDAIQTFNATKALATTALAGGAAVGVAASLENALTAAEPFLPELLALL